MWSTVLLFIRRLIVRNKIKKETKGATVKQAKQILKSARGPIQDSNKRGKIKKLKGLMFKDKTLTWSIRINILIALITVIVTVMIIASVTMLIGNLAGWSILSNREEEFAQEEDESGWEFDINDNALPNVPSISGGIYPKDPIIKNRALLLKILEQSAKDVQAEKGTMLYPEYLLGVIIRETGGYKILNLMDKNKDTSWLTSLSYSVPVCEKGSNCSYVKNGYSHFVGGSIVNGVDTGDPYTMEINYDKGIYKATGEDHALGFVQFEIPLIPGRMTRNFPVSSLGLSSESDINFIRPNFFYIPDQLYSMAFLIGGYSMNSSNYHTIVDSEDFKSLDERNQTFVMFMMQQGYYAGGGVKDSYITAFNELMSAYKSGKIEHFDEMLMVYKDKFYDTTTHSMKNFDVAGCKQYIKDTYGVYATSFKSTAWYGIYAACAGRAAWELMQKEIDAAEKEAGTSGLQTGGNWLEYVGSGHFAPIGDGTYYSKSAQSTIYRQTSSTTAYSGSGWGSITDSDGSSLEIAGCGVYSTAFCITNLTGTLVTVKDLVDNKLITRWPAEEPQILKAAKHYGLDAYTVETKKVNTDDKTFEDWVIGELKDGALIIQVFWGSQAFYNNNRNPAPGYSLSDYKNDSFEWYNSKSHYMVIKGYNNTNNKLRVFSSVGGPAGGFEALQNVELSAGRVRKFVNTRYYPNYNFIVIKPKGGAGSLGGTTGTTGTTGGSTSGTTGSTTGSAEYIWPVSSKYYRLSSLFGKRIHPITGKPNNHLGIDIPANGGEPIYAAKSGIVETANTSYTPGKGYGIYVKIKHADGSSTLYAHMSKIGTTTGATVNQGDVIGYVGTTGSSTGNHLHFEVKNSGGTRLDPVNMYPNLPLYVSDSSGKKVYL